MQQIGTTTNFRFRQRNDTVSNYDYTFPLQPSIPSKDVIPMRNRGIFVRRIFSVRVRTTAGGIQAQPPNSDRRQWHLVGGRAVLANRRDIHALTLARNSQRQRQNEKFDEKLHGSSTQYTLSREFAPRVRQSCNASPKYTVDVCVGDAAPAARRNRLFVNCMGLARVPGKIPQLRSG